MFERLEKFSKNESENEMFSGTEMSRGGLVKVLSEHFAPYYDGRCSPFLYVWGCNTLVTHLHVAARGFNESAFQGVHGLTPLLTEVRAEKGISSQFGSFAKRRFA